jgi:hypothetical protein
MSKVYNSQGSVTTGSWSIKPQHHVTYVMTSVTGLFARHEGSSTVYTCTCGRTSQTSLRALKADLAGHDEWKTAEQVESDRIAFSAMLDDLLGQIA